MFGMRRRDFVVLLGGAAVAWPLAARAQQPAKAPIIGFLGAATASAWRPWTAVFVQRLGDLGWIEGRTVTIEYRWAEGRPERYAEIAAEFVRLKVDVIVTVASAVPALRQATSVIPIVFALANDPVGGGLVASLSRPGGSVTGLSNQGVDLAGKRLELLREVRPDLRRLAILTNVGFSESVLEMREAEAGAHNLGIEVSKLEIRRAADIAPAFEALKRQADALYVVVDALVAANRTRIITFALAAHLPTIFNTGTYVEAGALMSYGPNFPDLYRRTADYVDQDSARSKTRRPTGRAADQVRSRCQLDHRQGARPRNSATAARPRRRGDRMMKRREFITLLGCAATVWPLTARAQQPSRVRRIGVLVNLAADDSETQARVGAFLQGLQGFGWEIGGNARFEYRWAPDADSIRKHAVEITALAPDVILANANPTVLALQQATRTLPIVFVAVTDPVAGGFVESLARPGGNATGFTSAEFGMSAKWLELLKELMPGMSRVAVLQDPGNPGGIPQFAAIQTVAPTLGVELRSLGLREAGEIESSIAAFASGSNSGLIVTRTSGAIAQRELIIKLAARHRLPAMYPLRLFATGGGLMSYGPDIVHQYRQAAGYVDRILRGEKPADLPVQAPTKYELAINLKTAKALGLEIPPTLLARADEVIE